MLRFTAFLTLLLLLGVSLSESPVFAGGEGDIFARLLAKGALLRDTPSFRTFARTFLGPESAEFADEQIVEAALRRMQAANDLKLAKVLENRFDRIQRAYEAELALQPNQNIEGLLERLSAERFRFLNYTTSGREMVDLNALRAAAESVTKNYPGLFKTLEKYEVFAKQTAGFEALFSREQVYRQLADEELSSFSTTLDEVLNQLSLAPANLDTDGKVRWSLERVLLGKVPANSIPERIRALIAGEAGSFRRAMGDMSLKEVQRLFHGGDPLDPTPESLLGQYLHETGAATRIRAFENLAAMEMGKAEAKGPRKLVVALSPESLPVFERLFFRKEWMSVVGHAHSVHNGKRIPYAGPAANFRLPETEFTPFPVVLLKSTEADRLAQYYKLYLREGAGKKTWVHNASEPWLLDGYCATSAWSGSCTQHLGNLPIGDNLLMEYKMPGSKPGRDRLNPQPLVQPLKQFASDDPLLRRVWKVPGNERFSSLLGQEDANLRGEFANPGWTIWTLLGPTTVERVPVVFVVRPDHKLPIPADFGPEVEFPL